MNSSQRYRSSLFVSGFFLTIFTFTVILLLTSGTEGYRYIALSQISLVLVVFSFIGGLIAKNAERKGRNFWSFYAISFLISPLFSGIVVAILPSQSFQGSGAEASGTKTCPKCAETVQAAAVVCRFCSHSFGPEATNLTGG